MGKSKSKLAYITFVYWFLLLYVVAALVWWFIALQQQNDRIASLRAEVYGSSGSGSQQQIETLRKRKRGQYIGEGTIFLLVMGVGASFVYLATRRLLNLERQQRNFMMAITHELKTPIAAARLHVETLRRASLEEVQKERLLQMTLYETQRLNDLCDNILLASKFEAGTFRNDFSPLLLSQLVSEIVSQSQQRNPRSSLHLRKAENTWVNGDAFLLKILIGNLVDNALKYAPAGSDVQITMEASDTHCVLQVADQGSGIPLTERRKVFAKFYRMGNEDTRKAQGTGLGLYLVKKIAEQHNAQVDICDNQPKGTVVKVIFNRTNPI